MKKPEFEAFMESETAVLLSPIVRNVRVMQTKTLNGSFLDYDYVMTIVSGGEIGVYADDKRYTLRKGDVILMPIMMKHIIIPVSDHIATQNIFHFDFFSDMNRMHIRGNDVEKVESESPASAQERSVLSHPMLMHLDGQSLLDLQALFAQMHMCYTKNSPLCLLEMRHLCMQILLLLYTAGKNTQHSYEFSGSKVHINVQRAADYIHRNYDDPYLCNEAIAQVLEITPQYLSHIFKKTLGISIRKYITQIRIDAALKMMSSQQYNITEIASGVGYSSIYSFSKMFKSKTGQAPSDYMKQITAEEKDIYIKYIKKSIDCVP